jgi:hypothetical protein
MDSPKWAGCSFRIDTFMQEDGGQVNREEAPAAPIADP